jgi:biotin carboxylase
MGVELADKLIDNLSITNACNPKTTHYRRNKYAMHECLRNNNLSSIKQFKSNNKNKIVDWCLNHKTWPIVIKPLNSAASDGVTICESIDEVKTAIEKILNQENRLGIKNEEILAQEFLNGTQYFVNTV